LRFDGSEVEPDLTVRQPPSDRRASWEDVPIPLLVIEVLSPYTRRRDRGPKRDFYMDSGVGEYWIVDPDDECVTIVHRGRDDVTVRDQVAWLPSD
jgi:Uma2 family endonuclease